MYIHTHTHDGFSITRLNIEMAAMAMLSNKHLHKTCGVIMLYTTPAALFPTLTSERLLCCAVRHTSHKTFSPLCTLT